MNEYQWPEVFTSPDFEYPGVLDPGVDTKTRLGMAIADGLCGWANCCAGSPIPEGFGKGMVKIGAVVGVSPTPDGLDAAANKHFPQAEEKADGNA